MTHSRSQGNDHGPQLCRGGPSAPGQHGQVLGTFAHNIHHGEARPVTPGQGHRGEGSDHACPPPSALAGQTDLTDIETPDPLAGFYLQNGVFLQDHFRSFRLHTYLTRQLV